MKKVLILGANGFVGKYLIDEFINNNYEVVICDKNIDNKNIKNYTLDILNSEDLEKMIEEEQPDYLVNLAAISSVGLSFKIPKETMEVNVVGTINVLESIKKHIPTCKVLLIGSSEEYKESNEPLKETDPIDANSPYGISKIAQENIAKMYAQKYDLNIICTRSFNHTGLLQKDTFVIPSFCKQVAQIASVAKEGIVKVGNLDIYRDFSDVRDIVRIYRMLLENYNTGIYNVGSGKAYKLEELLKYIISLSGCDIKILKDPERVRKNEIKYICCDKTKLNCEFTYDIKNTIKEMYEYYKNIV